MIKNCIFKCQNVNFLSLMSQYMRKGDVNDQDSILSEKLIKLFDDKIDISRSIDLSQFLSHFFELCENCDVKFSKSTIEEALNKCQDEKCKEMLSQYIQMK